MAAVVRPSCAAAEACEAELPKAISFRVRHDLPIGDTPFSPYIHLADSAKSLANLEEADAIVLACRDIVVVADYPLRDEFKFPLRSSDEGGFRRGELARAVAEIYQRIYREEEATTRIPVVPPEKRKGLANRNQTDGTYGIWGHDLDDLDLSALVPIRRDGVVYATLEIDS